MAYRPCLELGCPRLVKRGRCREHTLARARAKRAQPRYDVYTDPRWLRTLRRAKLRAGNRCQAIEHGVRCPVTHGLHGHHDYPGGVEQMLLDDADPFDERHVVILCGSHHGRLEAWLRDQKRRSRR